MIGLAHRTKYVIACGHCEERIANIERVGDAAAAAMVNISLSANQTSLPA
jgi:hypothetical protein